MQKVFLKSLLADFSPDEVSITEGGPLEEILHEVPFDRGSTGSMIRDSTRLSFHAIFGEGEDAEIMMDFVAGNQLHDSNYAHTKRYRDDGGETVESGLKKLKKQPTYIVRSRFILSDYPGRPVILERSFVVYKVPPQPKG